MIADMGPAPDVDAGSEPRGIDHQRCHDQDALDWGIMPCRPREPQRFGGPGLPGTFSVFSSLPIATPNRSGVATTAGRQAHETAHCSTITDKDQGGAEVPLRRTLPVLIMIS